MYNVPNGSHCETRHTFNAQINSNYPKEYRTRDITCTFDFYKGKWTRRIESGSYVTIYDRSSKFGLNISDWTPLRASNISARAEDAVMQQHADANRPRETKVTRVNTEISTDQTKSKCRKFSLTSPLRNATADKPGVFSPASVVYQRLSLLIFN